VLPLYLHGGGAHPEAIQATFGLFAAAVRGRIALVAVGDDSESYFPHYRALFEYVDGVELVGIFLKSGETLTSAQLSAPNPAGVFVGGGETPLYYDALCRDRAWLDYLHERKLPFGGTSAGAMIAAERAIVGGWHIEHKGQGKQILYEGAGDNLDLLDVRQGLGLVSFSVDVHASQWGTLTRLVHAVHSGKTDSGWAIDEDTMLVVNGNTTSVVGRGQAYHVQRVNHAAQVTLHMPDSVTPL
jgi:cyanophycinase